MGQHQVIDNRVPPDWPHARFSRLVPSPPHRWHVQMAGNGPDLLLIHGAGGAVHSWRDLIAPLACRFRVVAIDLPGHGFTRLGVRNRSGLEPMCQDIRRLLDGLGVRPTAIAGHSAGAAIALRLAQILTPAPTRLVAINGALANFPGIAGIVFPIVAKALVLTPLTSTMVAATMTRRTAGRLIRGTGSALDPRGIDLYYRLFRDRHHVAGTLGMMEQWSLDSLLSSVETIAQPTLFLTGAKDLAVAPQASRSVAERMPFATCRTHPDAGHLLHEEHPERISQEILNFCADPENG